MRDLFCINSHALPVLGGLVFKGCSRGLMLNSHLYTILCFGFSERCSFNFPIISEKLTRQIMYIPEVELWPSTMMLHVYKRLQEGTVSVLYGHATLSNVTDTAVHSSFSLLLVLCLLVCVCVCTKLP